MQGKAISKQLLTWMQGADSVANFAINFRILAAESRWDEAPLQGVFSCELADNMKDETTSLEQLISLGI